MTKVKHTPEPWTIYRNNNGANVIAPEFDGEPVEKEAIAIVFDRPYGASIDAANAEVSANARLIAAAPELYMLLADAREAFLNGDMEDLRGILAGDICSETLEQIKGD